MPETKELFVTIEINTVSPLSSCFYCEITLKRNNNKGQ